MNAKAEAGGALLDPGSETANERFKRSFDSWFWSSMITATVLHFMVLAFWPRMLAEDISLVTDDIEVIVPPELIIPPPPESIARPAEPIISETMIDEEVTIQETTFESNLPMKFEAPPTRTTAAASDGPVFTPWTVKPRLLNDAEIKRALEREYPPLMRDVGIGGRAILWFHIDDTGVVRDARVYESAGHPDLDEAAVKIAGLMRFAPALNMDRQVWVWVQIPITFQVN